MLLIFIVIIITSIHSITPSILNPFSANPSHRIAFLFFSRSDSTDSLRIFTALYYAYAVYAMALCPCLSVCVCHKSVFY